MGLKPPHFDPATLLPNDRDESTGVRPVHKVVHNQCSSLGADNFAHDGQHVGRSAGVLRVDSEGTGAGVPGVPVRGVLLRGGAGGTNAKPEDAHAAAALNRLLVVLVEGRFGIAAEADLHANT